MTVRIATRWGVALMFLIGAARGTQAQEATTLTGEDIIRAMHDRYEKTWYSSLTFTQSTTRRTANDSLVRETWYESAKIPGRLRIDIDVKDGNHVILFNGDSTYAKFPNYPVHRTAGRNPLLILGFDVYKQPVERTVAVLRAEGFDLSKVRLQTWNGKSVYVVGADSGDSTSKQFWIDGDRMLFVRMLEAGRKPGASSEVRFEDYRQLGGGWIAMRVVATEGGMLMQDEVYSDPKIDIELPDSLFDPTALK